MNYTKNTTSCKQNPQILQNKTDNYTFESQISLSLSCSKEKLNVGDKSDPLLGNREIGKHYKKIYEKYQRKNIAQYALTVENVEEIRLAKNEKKTRLSKHEFNTRLRFKETLKTINKSLCSCGRDLHFMNFKKTVDVKETSNSRRLKGLKSCGNNSACPVCAAKLSTIRGNQLKELMKGGRENGRSYMMVVTTIPHKPLEPLYRTLNQVIHMSRYIFNSREYKNFKKKSFCRFVHGGLENMVSFKNGQIDWHPHKNYLLDFDISINEVIENLGLKTEKELRMYVSQMMTRIGQKYLLKENIDKTLLSPYFQQGKDSSRIYVKGGVTASLEFDDGYIAKWGLEAEMTSGIYKDGRITGSMHPFGLLDLINEENEEATKEQKYQAVKAFQEFVVASKGKWWFYFGVGAIDYYNEYYRMKLKVKKDEEELATLEDEGDLIYFMDEQEWLDFRPNPKKVGYALSLPTREEVVQFFMEEIEFNRLHINTR